MGLNRATRLLVEALMTEATKRRIRDKRKRKLCIRAGCTNPAKPGRRGDCEEHFNQFDYARRLAGPPGSEERQLFDDSEVAAGNVLPPKRGRKPKAGNPYLKAL